MIRALLFTALASALVIYPYWVYRRVELPVSSSHWLAFIRATALLIILALLFDLQIPPVSNKDTIGERWVLLDASLSMLSGNDELTAWDKAVHRSNELVEEGWSVFTFSEVLGAFPLSQSDLELGPQGVNTFLVPALISAAEAGVRSVHILSDLRFEDRVALRAALEELPIDVTYEAFGTEVVNAGVSEFEVEDAMSPGTTIFSEVEIHGSGADSAELTIRIEGVEAVSQRVSLPEIGLVSLLQVPILAPNIEGRVRYTAHLKLDGDAFPSDDEAVAYGVVGNEENSVVLVSLRPNWEPRHLLSVLGDVTGLPTVGYLRAGSDQFVSIGTALARSVPVDTTRVRRAVDEAALVVIQGFNGTLNSWTLGLLEKSMRAILIPSDSSGAAIAGLSTEASRGGEWYVSSELSPSPLSVELVGATLLGLPPLTDLLIPISSEGARSPLQVQLRGTGSSEAVLYLDTSGPHRRIFALASGFWRWSARDGSAEETYRRLWSGVTGWLFADEKLLAREPRPSKWVFQRKEPVTWIVPGDSSVMNLRVMKDDSLITDTVMSGGISSATGFLSPGLYSYSFDRLAGDLVREGRFDVEEISGEMIPPREEPEARRSLALIGTGDSDWSIRTSSWPYLLVIILLCAEWIFRRRTGLR